MQELMGIIDLFKKGKAPGPDNITTDFLKDLEHEEIRTHMLDLINQWWTTGDIPDDITLARVVSLYKKGNPELQENYRPISLLNSFYKILAKCVQLRLAEGLNKFITKTQYGFIAERSTVDAIFLVRRLQEYCKGKGSEDCSYYWIGRRLSIKSPTNGSS